jgi:hypothetical protein
MLRGSKGVGLLYNPMGKLKFRTLMLITSNHAKLIKTLIEI